VVNPTHKELAPFGLSLKKMMFKELLIYLPFKAHTIYIVYGGGSAKYEYFSIKYKSV